MKQILFFDSYAIMEIFRGNESYLKFKKVIPVITKLNLFEIYYNVLWQVGKKEAEELFGEYLPYVVEFNNEDIKRASHLKARFRRQKISMTDCIGYVIAERLEIMFLTGDKEFKNFRNVVFVK
ncbi:PIN domain-containing protein [Candidatus Pacearchaeota archaeon]|nr:PIN domain-containing protein [Candidatus Pacearchaeota archaeon]